MIKQNLKGKGKGVMKKGSWNRLFSAECTVCVCVCVCSVVSHSLGWDPTDCSPPGSSVHRISQARKLKWVAISFTRGSSRPRDRTCVSCASDSLPLHHLGSPRVHSRFSQIHVSININSNIEPIKNLPQINWVYIFALRKLYGTSCKLVCIYFVMIPGT